MITVALQATDVDTRRSLGRIAVTSLQKSVASLRGMPVYVIALTARRHGATVVTANREDFQLLAKELRVSILTA